MNKKRKTVYGERSRTVFVGMSGGVDSSVSAALLKKQGFDVIGVFIKTWHPNFIKCNEEEERRDAMRVATFLDIPFLTFDLEEVYKKQVADYMISEYKAGRTPNPDVMCNKEVKFGAFMKKSLEMGADYVATGHYAQNIKNNLVKAKDPSKDQVYFLWTLNKKLLSKIIFPVGNLNKTEVRKLASKFKIPVAEKKDSQGICFLGAVDLKDFLKHYIKEKRGKVLNEKGEEIGFHDGAVFHTLGERHGFTITKKKTDSKPFYIIKKDIKKNILYVSNSPESSFFSGPRAKTPDHSKKKLSGSFIILKNLNWINSMPKVNKKYTAQIRYHGEFLNCRIKKLNKNKAEINFEKKILVAAGQSCVFYDKNICLGGGVIV